jgi:4-amino-4-deoxy-L-arabinose transferase-like glycosyltransferase
MRKLTFVSAFFLVVFLAFILRIWHFGTLPASLYFEEPALGFDAYSIFKTGKDMHGNPFPVVAFPSFGDFKPSGYFYITAPFVGVLGMTEASVRIPSLLLGMATVVSVMLIALGINKSKAMALFSGLAIALMPSAVHLSRAAFEVNAAVGLLSMSLASLVWTKKHQVLLPMSVVVLAASMYTYHSLRVTAPLLYLLTFFVFLDPVSRVRAKITWASAGLFLVLVLPILLAMRTPEVAHRFQEVAFFPHYSQAVALSNAKRAEYGNTLLSRIVYHRYWIQAHEFSQNILKHFSTEFLLVRGDGNLRHQDASKGLLYWWMMGAMVTSLLMALLSKRVSWRMALFFGLGLLISAVPASLAVPVPHTLRNHTSVLLWSLLVGWAAAQLHLRLSKRPILLIALGLVIVADTASFFGNYFRFYNQKSYADWGYGYKQVAAFIAQEVSDNESVFMTRDYGRPITYMLFYLNADPRLVQASAESAPKDQQELLTFANIDFIDRKQAYDWRIESQPFMNSDYLLDQVINDPNQRPVFYLYKKH